MNILRNALIIVLLSSTVAMAAPASEDSIEQLLAVVQAQKLLDDVLNQFDARMNSTVQQTLKGKTPDTREQQAINNMKSKMGVLIREELSWEKIKPIYIRIYKESLTEEEVAGILSFYKTPAGQALIHKMPVLQQKTILEIRILIDVLMPRMTKIYQEYDAELNATTK